MKRTPAESPARSLLPPETVLALIGAATLVLTPHLVHLPMWTGILFVLAIAWRWHVTQPYGWAPLPGKYFLVTVTFLVIALLLLSYQTLLGRDAGVGLLSAMLALKFLELRTLRDARVLNLLCYLLIMAHLLYDQSLLMASYVLAAVVVVLSSQLLVDRPQTGIAPRAALQLSLRMTAQAIPFMLILFILFPRIPGPLWGLPKDAHRGLTGLSDEMTPGLISELSRSDAVAFRVRFNGPIPPRQQLYWRGPVLWQFDGRTWRQLDDPPLQQLVYQSAGEPLDYAVVLEPHGKRWLFMLDLPVQLPPDSSITPSLHVLRNRPVNEVLRYEGRSYLHYNTGDLEALWQQRALYLPSGSNPQARALAEQWRREALTPEQVVQRTLRYFREQPFYYTLEPPRLGVHSIDEFLFTTRRGFCEHYAGSFVFLMRAAGIPARIVTGYQGGERNDLGDYFIVRQSDAHAWAEVWLAGHGWVRIDPTSAVAPNRIEQGLYAAVEDTGLLPLMARRDYAWMRQLVLGWDSLNNAWNEWVLAYGPERQREFLSKLGFGPVDWQQMILAMVILLALLSSIFALLYAWNNRTSCDPIAQAYQRFCTRLARCQLPRAAAEGPLTFAERVSAQRPDLAASVQKITTLYSNLRYGSIATAQDIKTLQKLTRDFKA